MGRFGLWRAYALRLNVGGEECRRGLQIQLISLEARSRFETGNESMKWYALSHNPRSCSSFYKWRQGYRGGWMWENGMSRSTVRYLNIFADMSDCSCLVASPLMKWYALGLYPRSSSHLPGHILLSEVARSHYLCEVGGETQNQSYS